MLGRILGRICFPCLVSNLAVSFCIGAGLYLLKHALGKTRSKPWVNAGVEEAAKRTLSQLGGSARYCGNPCRGAGPVVAYASSQLRRVFFWERHLDR